MLHRDSGFIYTKNQRHLSFCEQATGCVLQQLMVLHQISSSSHRFLLPAEGIAPHAKDGHVF